MYTNSEKRLYRQGRCVYLLDNVTKTAQIVKGERIGRRRKYRIPHSVVVNGEYYTIDFVEINAYKSTKHLKNLIVPDNISFVDEYNFSNIRNLRRIHIGKGVKYISSWIFSLNKKLQTFIVDKHNKYIHFDGVTIYSKDGKVALASPFEPKQICIREGVERIEATAYWYNDNLEKIIFPSTLKIIGDNSFSHCANLKEIGLPEGCEKLDIQCFEGCKKLEIVDLPSTIKCLNGDAFDGCEAMKCISIRCKKVLEPLIYRENQFNFLNKCTVRVPKCLIGEYRAHSVWGKCKLVEACD